MEMLWFLGGFTAVAIGLFVICRRIKRKLRRFSQQVLGSADLLSALSELDTEVEETPRSLSGCDSLLLPKILEDFPDYDPVMAKTYVKDHLRKLYGQEEGFEIYNVVIARYLPSAAQKTIVFQAAVSWMENGRRSQKRFELNYSYLLSQEQTSVAANCPNCGGALGYGVSVCPFCESRVANVLKNTWVFTEVKEK